MKRIFLLIGVIIAASACTKEDFEESYADPAKVSTTSVEKQYAGFLAANSEYVIPSYWNYFVVLRPTVNRWNQAVGWVNAPVIYVILRFKAGLNTCFHRDTVQFVGERFKIVQHFCV